MDKKLFLLGFYKDTNKLTFHKRIKSLEFVELIGDMDLDCSVNYIKRNLYLKKMRQKLFENFKHKKESKIRIEISHDIVYISKTANKLKLFLNKLFKLKMIININILKYKNYPNSINYNKIDYKKSKILSREEIDTLLTEINGSALKHVPEELKTYELCLEAVKEYGCALEYVPQKHKTAELCLEAVKKNGRALEYVPKEHKTAELCLEAVKEYSYALKYVPEEHKTAELCLVAMRR